MQAPNRTFLLIGALALFTVLASKATAQSYNAICTLPDGSLLQVGDKDDVPIMAKFDSAWEVQANPEGTPAIGEFTAVCADASGNLFVAFENTSNAKKKVEGLLRRVGDTWSLLPPLSKGWSGVYDPVALGPDRLWFRSWHSEERRTLLVHWNGTEYSLLPLPADMKELNTLFLDTDGALLTDGDMGDKEGVYRFTDGTWRPMGEAMNVLSVERFVRLSDGTLVCIADKYSDQKNTLFQWRGERWSPLKGAELSGDREVEDLCTGPDGRLYLLIEADDEEGDPQRLACWQNGTLRWHKGSEQKAIQEKDLYQLACDRSGLLHARDYSKQRTFPWSDFEWATDGYPATDARAAAVWDLYKQQRVTYAEVTKGVHDAYAMLIKEPTELNSLQVGTRYNEFYTWYSTRSDTLVDLVPKGTNRLVDRYREVLASANLMYAALRDHASAVGRGGEPAWEKQLLDKVLAATEMNKRTAQALDAEVLAYPLRNGLTPLPVIINEVRDPYPPKDVKAAEVLAIVNGNKEPYNRHVAFCRSALISVDNLSGAAAFELDKYVNDSLHTWVASVNKQLDALSVPPQQNRLQDAFRHLLTKVGYMGHGLQAYASLRTGNSTADEWREQADRLEALQSDLTSTINVLNKVYSEYLLRNGL